MGVHALYTAASGMDTQLRNIDVIANNVANVNTEGFRRDRVNFADHFYREQALAGAAGQGPGAQPSGTYVGHGARVVSTEKSFTPGGITITDNQTHIAIQGPGNLFFQVEDAAGNTAYTRAGNFLLSNQGEFVTPSGQSLVGVAGVPQEASAIKVMIDGVIEARVGIEDPEQVGQVQLARFVNPAGLRPGGDNLYYATPAAGQAELVTPGTPGNGSLLGGAIEGSNVNAITELVKLIQGQRAYEINSNVVRAADEALQIANNLRG
ncbi:MAG: flagellar basal-body rod protein FlgG [Planctomycetota bacterium]